MFIAALFGAGCSIFLAIVTTIAARRSQMKNPKIVYTTISVVLAGFAVLLLVWSLPKPPLDFTAVAPVPSSLTMYFAENELGSGTTLHDELYALRVRDGSTRFTRTYPVTSPDTTVEVEFLSNGVLYTEESTGINSTRSVMLKALRLNNGSEIWQTLLPGIPGNLHLDPEPARLFIHDDVLYIDIVNHSSRESVYALRVSDGSTIWQQALPNQSFSGGEVIAYDNGMIYLNSAGIDHVIFALRASDGKVLWQSPFLHSDADQVSVASGIVYVNDPNTSSPGILYAFRDDTGALLWQVSDVANFSTVNGVVYVVQHSGTFAALRATDGTPFWQVTGEYLNVVQAASFPVVGDVAYVIGGTSGADASTIYAYRVTDGVLLWSHVTSGSRDVEKLAVADGIVYYSAGIGGILTALRAQDGSVQWQHNATDTNTTYGVPTIVDGVLVVPSSDVRNFCFVACGEGGYINVFSAATGTPYWRYRITYVTPVITIADAV